MKRAAILGGAFRYEARKRWSGTEWFVALNLFLAWLIVVVSIFPAFFRTHPLWTCAPAAVLAFLTLIFWNTWRAKSELSEMAFKVWMDQCRSIARHYDLDLEDVEFGASCSVIWKNRWRGGITPDQAVHQELDRRELEECQKGKL